MAKVVILVGASFVQPFIAFRFRICLRTGSKQASILLSSVVWRLVDLLGMVVYHGFVLPLDLEFSDLLCVRAEMVAMVIAPAPLHIRDGRLTLLARILRTPR